MNQQLTRVLDYIIEKHKSQAMSGARNYINVNIGEIALSLGFTELYETYKGREVVVSIKHPLPGMKVRIDGRTFVNYAEYAEGFAFPGHIAKKAGLPFKPYTANDSMILNYA